jgi:hypothetical protein
MTNKMTFSHGKMEIHDQVNDIPDTIASVTHAVRASEWEDSEICSETCESSVGTRLSIMSSGSTSSMSSMSTTSMSMSETEAGGSESDVSFVGRLSVATRLSVDNDDAMHNDPAKKPSNKFHRRKLTGAAEPEETCSQIDCDETPVPSPKSTTLCDSDEQVYGEILEHRLDIVSG